MRRAVLQLVILLFATLGLLAACSKTPPTPVEEKAQTTAIGVQPRPDTVEPPLMPSDPHDSVPKIYTKLFEGHIDLDEINPFVEKLPYESISLERTQCLGTCPAYLVTFHKSGKAELHAGAHLPQTGDFVGEINIFEYGKLCYTLDRLRFKDLKDRYEANWTDRPRFIVTAKTAKGPKQVSDYGPIGPIELWMVQEVIDSLRHRVEWKPKP